MKRYLSDNSLFSNLAKINSSSSTKNLLQLWDNNAVVNITNKSNTYNEISVIIPNIRWMHGRNSNRYPERSNFSLHPLLRPILLSYTSSWKFILKQIIWRKPRRNFHLNFWWNNCPHYSLVRRQFPFVNKFSALEISVTPTIIDFPWLLLFSVRGESVINLNHQLFQRSKNLLEHPWV